MTSDADGEDFRPDELDLKILEHLVENSGIEFKQLAKALEVDERTVARHIERMKQREVFRTTIEIDWQRLGVGASALVGSTTALGDRDVAKLYDFIRNDPRITEAYATVGAHEYLLKILETDLQRLRDGVLRPLEPLTADLAASIISSQMKRRDESSFLKFLRERHAAERRRKA